MLYGFLLSKAKEKMAILNRGIDRYAADRKRLAQISPLGFVLVSPSVDKNGGLFLLSYKYVRFLFLQ